jgi:cytochrome c oxidase subunit 4
MAHAHESNTKRIWIVFGILSAITIVEVYLGILKPEALHLQGENKWFRRSIVWSAVFLISYLVTLFLIEGGYLFDTLSPLVRW